MSGCPNGGEELVLLAAATAMGLAKSRSAAEIGVLAAFFTTLGEQLALLSLCGGQDGGDVKSL